MNEDVVITVRFIVRGTPKGKSPEQHAKDILHKKIVNPMQSFTIERYQILTDTMCANCGFDTDGFDPHPDEEWITLSPVTISNPSTGAESWTEYWICPDCGDEFEIENGN